MLNVGLFELVFFLGFALIFLGPEKLIELLKSAYQFYQKLKAMFQNLQSDLERELKLNELQQTLETEIAKVQDLERLLSQKIAIDLQQPQIIYQLMPYYSLDPIQQLTPVEQAQRCFSAGPLSYDMYNRKLLHSTTSFTS